MKLLKTTAKYLSLVGVCGFALTSAPLHAQFDDSTAGSRALAGRGIIPLKNQERETPVTNNITNTTNQITQVVQPNTYQVSGYGQGPTTAQAWANCGGGTLLGGGGSCTDNSGLVAVGSSEPSGNSWVIGCQSLNYRQVYATAYAVCSSN